MSDNMPVNTIDVYRDDPMWGNGKRWFQHPADKLADLHVASYEVRGYIEDVRAAAREVAKMHPNCILVHI